MTEVLNEQSTARIGFTCPALVPTAELDSVFAALAQLRVGGLVISSDSFFFTRSVHLTAFAARNACQRSSDFESSPRRRAMRENPILLLDEWTADTPSEMRWASRATTLRVTLIRNRGSTQLDRLTEGRLLADHARAPRALVHQPVSDLCTPTVPLEQCRRGSQRGR